MKTAYLSIGSNLGNREDNIGDAIAALAKRGIRVVKESSLYETEPVGFRDQGWFLNCAVEVETTLGPAELLEAIWGIEQSMGRHRTVPMGPRVIDIDIVLYDDQIVENENLSIPHPRMLARNFVLVPLDEIAPHVLHPIAQKTIHELLADSRDSSEVRPWLKADEGN